MKVLFVTDEIAPEVEGGAGNSTHLLARALIKHGVECRVFSAWDTRRVPRRPQDEYQGVYRRFYRTRHRRLVRHAVGLFNPVALLTLHRIIQEESPDIVHFHNVSKHISFSAFVLPWLHRIPGVFTARDTMAIAYRPITWYRVSSPGTRDYRATLWTTIRQAKNRYIPFRNAIIRYTIRITRTRVIAVSHEVQRALKQNHIPCRSVIHNPADVDLNPPVMNGRPRWAADVPVYLFAARLDGSKGFREVLQAHQRLCNQGYRFRLLIAAEESPVKRMIRSSLTSAARELVTPLGWLSTRELTEVTKLVNCVVVPSVYLDAFPRANLESLAVGTPVVTTIHGGSSELVRDGKEGFVVNPTDTDEFADRIRTLLTDVDLAKNMGERGKSRIQSQFTTAHAAQRHMAIYARRDTRRVKEE